MTLVKSSLFLLNSCVTINTISAVVQSVCCFIPTVAAWAGSKVKDRRNTTRIAATIAPARAEYK